MKAALDCHALHPGRGGYVTFFFKSARRFYHLWFGFTCMLRSFFFKMSWVLFVTVVVRVLLRLIVKFGVGKYLWNSCHLAAKFGTCLRLSPCMSSLLWVDDSQLELTLFSLYLPWIANYQIVMISFINSNTCRSIRCWLCWLLIFVYACSNLGWRIYWPLLWVFWFRHFLIIGGWCFSSYCGCFGNFSWINCYLGWWYLSYWVSSSGESWN